MSDRATRGYGAEIYECWGEFLDFRNEASDFLFTECFDGVRLMFKMNELNPMSNYNRRVIKRAELAASWGKKIHLVPDWFNSATGPGNYHAYPAPPFLNKTPAIVAEIIAKFPRVDILEVCNEPYYTKKKVDQPSMGTYAAYVDAFIRGADIANVNPYLLATQSNTDRKGNFRDDAWEWHHATGLRMLEGKHSAVLHDALSPSELDELIRGDWNNKSKSVGWRYPIYESEMAPGGKRVHVDSRTGYQMYERALQIGLETRLPIAFLTIRGDQPKFGELGNWPGAMHLINSKEKFSNAAKAILDYRGIDVPAGYDGVIEDRDLVPDEPPIPPIDPPNEEEPVADKKKLIERINEDLEELTRADLRAVKQVTKRLAALQ